MKLLSALFALCLLSFPALSFEPELIGGQAADPKEWPASAYCSMSGSRCSCTVVGERTLLIASHCVSNGGTASFSLGPNKYATKCTHGPGYPRNSTADWTLCLIDKKVEGVQYEKLLADGALLKDGDKVRLTGYGCVRKGGGGGNDGTFRVGYANVTDLPSGSNHDTVTKGGAALCFGDSGGAAYVEVGTQRFIFGVNSRGDISTTSYLSSVYVDAFKAFAESWASKNSQRLCGFHADALGCRGGVAPAPTDFEVDSAVAKVTGKVKPGYEAKLPDVKESVQRALDALK
jgi:hypothetical protein